MGWLNTGGSGFIGGGFGGTPAGGAPPSAAVSGAGTSAVNGTYTPRGTFDGKPYYNLVGQPDDPSLSSVRWSTAGGRWSIKDADDNIPYSALQDVDFPWLGTWEVQDGDEPPPTVTQG